MSESKLESNSEELSQAEQYVIEGKFEKAYKLMDILLARGEHTLKDTLLCNLQKIDILIQQGLYEGAIKLANQSYEESLRIKEKLIAFDALDLGVLGLLNLTKLDEVLERIKEGEQLLKIIHQKCPMEYKKKSASIELRKAWFYIQKNEAPKVKEHLDLCITLCEETGDNLKLAYALMSTVMYYAFLKGEFDQAIKNIEKGLVISANYQWKYGKAIGLLARGTVFSLQGDLEQSTIYHQQSLALFKELNNKDYTAHVLNNISWNYMMIGDMERALVCIESSMKYRKEQGKLKVLASNYDSLIKILIEKGDLEKAQKEIEQLELLKNQLNDKHINLQYLFDKALVLKTSPRSRNRIEAEDLFKKIIEDETIIYEMAIDSLLNLCELLLTELRITNDLSVLEEMDPYIIQLLQIAENNHSFILFAEIYFLKAKLALLTLDLKTARRFLTQAQRIAERFGINQLATKIISEHAKLRNQLGMWENLKKKEISLSERMKLAGMDEQIKYLLKNPAILTTQIEEEKITVHKERKICIICKGDILGFMYACKCGSFYCDKCTQALTEIENACWVCGAPIDITKPIKPYKEEEIREKDVLKKYHKNVKNDDLP